MSPAGFPLFRTRSIRLWWPEEALVAAISAIEAAGKAPNANATLINEARNLHREAQLRWDFIAAENSMGFHNPEEALRILAAATDLARQAQLKAVAASPAALQAIAVP
jgi:nitrite reductase (cytochrome c-552)